MLVEIGVMKGFDDLAHEQGVQAPVKLVDYQHLAIGDDVKEGAAKKEFLRTEGFIGKIKLRPYAPPGV